MIFGILIILYFNLIDELHKEIDLSRCIESEYCSPTDDING